MCQSCRKTFSIADTRPPHPGENAGPRDRYRIMNQEQLGCLNCGEQPALKSNKAIAEEIVRISGYLAPRPGLSCPNGACDNHGKPVEENPELYYRHGYAKSGSRRFACRLCKTTLSSPKATVAQHKPEKNIQFFKLLHSRISLSKIASVLEITVPTVYGKIDFLHEQCLAFLGDRERELPSRRFGEMFLATDRQSYLTNWQQNKDARRRVHPRNSRRVQRRRRCHGNPRPLCKAQHSGRQRERAPVALRFGTLMDCAAAPVEPCRIIASGKQRKSTRAGEDRKERVARAQAHRLCSAGIDQTQEDERHAFVEGEAQRRWRTGGRLKRRGKPTCFARLQCSRSCQNRTSRCLAPRGMPLSGSQQTRVVGGHQLFEFAAGLVRKGGPCRRGASPVAAGRRSGHQHRDGFRITQIVQYRPRSPPSISCASGSAAARRTRTRRRKRIPAPRLSSCVKAGARRGEVLLDERRSSTDAARHGAAARLAAV